MAELFRLVNYLDLSMTIYINIYYIFILLYYYYLLLLYIYIHIYCIHKFRYHAWSSLVNII